MYVRLAFAVAAHLDPEILVVDEVLAVGDAEFQKKCLGKMDAVSREEGRTVLCVSHNMGLLSSLCSTAIWLDNGTLQGYGPTQDIVSAYSTKVIEAGAKIVDLTKSSRPPHLHDERVRVECLEWLADLPLSHGQPLKVRVGFRVNSPISELALGIHFVGSSGTRILSYNTDFLDMNWPNVVTGTYSAEMHLDSLPLQPDSYKIDISVRSGDAHILDIIAGFVSAEVVAGPTTPAFMAQKFAGVRLPS